MIAYLTCDVSYSPQVSCDVSYSPQVSMEFHELNKGVGCKWKTFILI